MKLNFKYEEDIDLEIRNLVLGSLFVRLSSHMKVEFENRTKNYEKY